MVENQGGEAAGKYACVGHVPGDQKRVEAGLDLDERGRESARRMLKIALEPEVTDRIAEHHKLRDKEGRAWWCGTGWTGREAVATVGRGASTSTVGSAMYRRYPTLRAYL